MGEGTPLCATFPQRSDSGKQNHYSAQMTLTIGYIWEETLSLSDLLDFNHGKSGVTLRNRVLYLSHLRKLGGSLRLMILNYSQARAQGPSPPHPASQTSCVQHGTGWVGWWVYPGWYGGYIVGRLVYPPGYPGYMYRKVYTYQDTRATCTGRYIPPMVPGRHAREAYTPYGTREAC